MGCGASTHGTGQPWEPAGPVHDSKTGAAHKTRSLRADSRSSALPTQILVSMHPSSECVRGRPRELRFRVEIVDACAPCHLFRLVRVTTIPVLALLRIRRATSRSLILCANYLRAERPEQGIQSSGTILRQPAGADTVDPDEQPEPPRDRHEVSGTISWVRTCCCLCVRPVAWPLLTACVGLCQAY